MQSTPSVNTLDYPVPAGEVLVSKTDIEGKITYCNSTFVDVSGYRSDELIDATHSIVRHPDMPHEAFVDLWKTIQANKPWRGLLKNKRKDGRAYWLEANITPLLEKGKTVGYVSFCYKATKEQIAQTSAAYQKICEGTPRLRIEAGKVVQVENPLLRWLNARSIKFRLVIFMTVLFSLLVAIGVFSLHEASDFHNLSVKSLEKARMQAYALDTARVAELALQAQFKAWSDIFIDSDDVVVFTRHLKHFDQQGDIFEDNLSRLKLTMQKIGMPIADVDALLALHNNLVEKHHHALKLFELERSKTRRSVNDLVKNYDVSMTVQLHKVSSEIQLAQQNGLNDMNLTIEHAYDTEHNRSIAVLTAAALIGLFLSMRFIVSVAKPIRSTTSTLKKVVRLQQHFLKIILKLEVYRDRIDEEQRIGSYIMARITHPDEKLDARVQQLVRPAERFSGDMLLATRTRVDSLHILLADAVGHGLAAAVNVLPLSQTFEVMSEKGFSIAHIAEELNKKINKFMPADRFVAATLVSINRQAHTIEVWNGGIPTLRLFNHDGQLLQSWPSRNLPLGILGDEEFVVKPELFHYEEDCQLCLFSDGLVEAMSPQGVAFGYERIAALFEKTPHDARFDVLTAQLDKHLQGQPAHDDITLAIVNIAMGVDVNSHVACVSNTVESNDWRIKMSLSAHELKYLDVVALLTDFVAKIHVTQKHKSTLFLILSELFNNALDHGVLQLDSSIKLGIDGIDQFLQLRDMRMQALNSGQIELEVERVLIESQPAIRIRVRDSGKGFSHELIRIKHAERTAGAQYGMGISLVQSLTYKLEYIGDGNEAVAYYICA